VGARHHGGFPAAPRPYHTGAAKFGAPVFIFWVVASADLGLVVGPRADHTGAEGNDGMAGFICRVVACDDLAFEVGPRPDPTGEGNDGSAGFICRVVACDDLAFEVGPRVSHRLGDG
jgi:hypothetical protein